MGVESRATLAIISYDEKTCAEGASRPDAEINQKSGVFATGMGYSWSLNDCS
jgi:hypothetical protein